MIPKVYEIDDPDRLPGEVVLTDPLDYDLTDYYPYTVNYELNLDYDPVNDPDEIDQLFDPYEDIIEDDKYEEEDNTIIQSDSILADNDHEPNSFYGNDENYDAMDTFYVNYNRKRRHKSLEHLVQKTLSRDVYSSRSRSIFSSSPSSTTKADKRNVISSKNKGKRRLDDYFGGFAVT